MHKLRLWLILLGLGLIFLDKYSIISEFRNASAIFIQNQINTISYKIAKYLQLIKWAKEQHKLEEQNSQLKKQVEEYAVLLKQTKNETEDLKELRKLDPYKLAEGSKTVIAKVILDVNFFVNNQLLINKGTKDKIQIGDAVINKDGLIGQVASINPTSARINMITHPEYKIYLQDSNTQSKMLAQGAGANAISVKYIAKTNKVQVGDILTTTGLDNIYPANIPVARVVKVFKENNGFNSALCVPTIDLNKLQYVVIVSHNNL